MCTGIAVLYGAGAATSNNVSLLGLLLLVAVLIALSTLVLNAERIERWPAVGEELKRREQRDLEC